MSFSPRNYALLMLLAIIIAGGAVFAFSPGAALADTELITNGSFASGSAEDLVIGGTITDYREGSCFARAMLIGLGSA